MKNLLILLLALVLVFGSVQVVAAGEEPPVEPPIEPPLCKTFPIYVLHAINGEDLGLSMELPVIAEVFYEGELLAGIPLKYMESFRAELPAGEYYIRVFSVELDDYVPGMELGPVTLEGCIKVAVYAKLKGGTTPALIARVRELPTATAK